MTARAAKRCTKCSWRGNHSAWGVPFFRSNFWGSPGQAAVRLQGITFSPLSSCGVRKQSRGASFSGVTPKGKVLVVCVTERGEVGRTVGCLSS